MNDLIDSPNVIRAVANFWIAFACMVFASFLIWRGSRESHLTGPIPGRIIFGAFLALLAYDRAFVAFVRLLVDSPRERTQWVESWLSVAPLVLCSLLAAWTLFRFWRNDLGDQHK